MNNNPLISIITATYNAEKYLKDCLNGIRKQTNSCFEYIIIDGGSTDKTLEIIKKNIDIIDKYISEPDKGIYDAWNKGVKLAKGDWVAFLGADDILLEDAIENYYNYTKSINCKQFDLINSKIEIIGDNNKYIKTIGEPWNWNKFKKSMIISHVMMLHNKNIFKKYGFFNTDYKIVADSELLLRAGKEINAIFMNKTTTLVRRGGVSFSYKALIESANAKCKTAKRNKVIVFTEFIFHLNSFYRRKIIIFFQKLFSK